MSTLVDILNFTIFDEISWIGLTYFLAGISVVYLAWRSTYVRHADRFDLYRRRTLFIFNPQTGEFQRHPIIIQPQESSIVGSSNSVSNSTATSTAPTANGSDQLDADGDSFPTDSEDTNIVHLQAPLLTLESILDEVNGIATGAHYHAQRQAENLEAELMDDDAREIIREMDRDITETNDGLRRRVNIFSREDDEEPSATTSSAIPASSSASSASSPSLSSTLTVTQSVSAPIQSSSNQVNRIETIHNVEATTSRSPDVVDAKGGNGESSTVDSLDNGGQSQSTIAGDLSQSDLTFGDELTIKLKYLNDDLKIVKARPNEPIGDFKKRNFNEELSAQKLVRLVFNGHVLQPDSKTVTACGLFDNCVVHCLIHNPRPNVTPVQNPPNDSPAMQTINDGTGNEQIGIENLITANRNRNRNTQRLLNLSLFLICLSVIISWFFRIQYFQLFTWYSTVGLVLLTTFFLVIIPLIFLIEREIFRNL